MRAFFSAGGLPPAGVVDFFMLTRAFMAPMAATARTRSSRSVRVSRLSSQIRDLACPGEQLSCMSHYRGLVLISKIIVRQGQ